MLFTVVLAAAFPFEAKSVRLLAVIRPVIPIELAAVSATLAVPAVRLPAPVSEPVSDRMLTAPLAVLIRSSATSLASTIVSELPLPRSVTLRLSTAVLIAEVPLAVAVSRPPRT